MLLLFCVRLWLPRGSTRTDTLFPHPTLFRTLGGIGSLPGAMLGGILIGLIEAFWSGYFSVEYKDVAVFSVLVLVLIFRPTGLLGKPERSEEHTSELQSLMRTSYAVFCVKKKKNTNKQTLRAHYHESNNK